MRDVFIGKVEEVADEDGGGTGVLADLVGCLEEGTEFLENENVSEKLFVFRVVCDGVG